MLIKSYQIQAEQFLKTYVTADPFLVYTSFVVGIFACKTVPTHFISPSITQHLKIDTFCSLWSLMISFSFSYFQAYDLSDLFSVFFFKCYLNLTKSRQVEWSNRWVIRYLSFLFVCLVIVTFVMRCRAMSTFHALYISSMALYLVFCSDVFSDNLHRGPITLRSSKLSTFALGVSSYILVISPLYTLCSCCPQYWQVS